MTAISQIIRSEDAARVLADPMRRRMLLRLVEPDSAAGLARATGLPRQRINYHLRELQRAGLVRLVKTQKKRNCVERLMQATATSYVISPEVLGDLAADPNKVADKLSAAYLVALAARTISELAVLRERADAAGKTLPTFTLHADAKFPSQQALNAFTEELSNTVAKLIQKHTRDDASDGRTYRFMVGAYPSITKTEADARSEAALARTERKEGGAENVAAAKPK